MGWLSWIPKIFKGTKDVAEVFVENKEAKGQREHLEKMADAELNAAVLKQFSEEFHGRANRTWWDSLVDGLNRLPRPVITFGVLSFFVLAPMYPEKFLAIAKAYELMPDGYWALLGIIIAFYFGGRMQLKSQDMKVKGDAVQAAKDLVAMRKEFRKLAEEEEPPEEKTYQAALASGAQPIQNQVVKKWRERQAKTGGDGDTDLGW
jgi:hypothetical protein